MEEVRNKTEVKPLKDPKTGLFQEGNPGGPGRPAGSRSFTTKVKEALEKIAEGKDYTYEEAFIKTILKKGIVDGDTSMIRTIWEQLDGKPLQKTDITTGGESLNKVLVEFIDGKPKDNKNPDGIPKAV